VFILGLPRTGTTSISVALLQQGFKVAHTAYTKHAFELADVVADAPCFWDYPQLDKLFPNAKFVYVDRALEQWVPSMQMLLSKMLPQLADKTGYLHPVLKRCMNQCFELATADNPLSEQHLSDCYLRHQAQVSNYFSGREDFLTLQLGAPGNLEKLLQFLGCNDSEVMDFPHLNIGKQVDSWKEFKHPNKINPLSAGREHRKFFDY
jgi:hypothetical protein